MFLKQGILFFFFLFTSFVYSKGEANIWYFGQNAGLDFNSGVPVALTNGQLVTDEGCATISNSSGQLLFYTDGVTVYNKNHTVMVNGTGLLGHSSSMQSATIVPKPGSSNLFYIFTHQKRNYCRLLTIYKILVDTMINKNKIKIEIEITLRVFLLSFDCLRDPVLLPLSE